MTKHTKKAAVTEEAESHFDIPPPLSKAELTESAWRRLRDTADAQRDRLLEKQRADRLAAAANASAAVKKAKATA
jgi:hypothetical protein